MFSLEDDDDGDFSAPPRGSSKLASLFGSEGSTSTQGNDSLMYTPQKQPKPREGSGSQKGEEALMLVHAVAAHTYRFVNGKYASQGKLGLAVLGNPSSRDYKLLLYVSQKQPVAAAKISPNFSYTVQNGNYAVFQDDNGQMWSICFDTESQAEDFAKQVAVAKYNSQGVTLVSLDLASGEGQGVEKGDTVEVQYKGWLLTDHLIGKVFDTNEQGGKLFKFKVGRGKVIKGWEEGIIGLKRGGKRILVIPPGLAYGSKGMPNRIPGHASLLFTVSLKRAKFSNPEPTDAAGQPLSRTESPSHAKSEIAPISMPAGPQLPKIGDPPSGKWEAKQENNTEISPEQDGSIRRIERSESQEGVKARSQSINEQLSKSVEKSNDKAKLLARMSKMGQAMLPLTASGSVDNDSDGEEEQRKEVSHTIVEDETGKSGNDSDAAASRRSAQLPGVGTGSPPKPHVRPKPEHVSRANSASDQPQPSNVPQGYGMHAQSFGPTGPAGYPFQPQQQLAVFQPQPSVYSFGAGQPGPYAPVTATASYGAAELNLLITESKVNHSEMKMTLSRVTEKIDDLHKKLDGVGHSQLQMLRPPSSPVPAAEMEASVLMANITRIVQDNERLRNDCREKGAKIDGLNQKMADLLQKNQEYLERSNQFMEKRADSMNDNNAQAMSKIVLLEQEKASVAAKLSLTQEELERLRQRESELREAKTELENNMEKVKADRDRLKTALTQNDSTVNETKDEIENLRKIVKETKKERKKLTLKVERAEEEIAELKLDKESLEKSVNERKNKLKVEKKKHEEDVDELKNSHEEELKALRDFYQKGGKSEEAKIAAIEENLRAKYESERTKAIEDLNERWQEKFEDICNERDTLRRRTESLSNQLSKSGLELEDFSMLKQRVTELEDEKSKIEHALLATRQAASQKAEDFTKSIKEAEAKGFEEGLKEGMGKANVAGQRKESGNENQKDISEEIKKVMNGVFFKLRSEFQPYQTYSGKAVISELLQTIKEVTLSFVQKKDTVEAEKGEEEEEEEEDDDEEDDDEEEEDESEEDNEEEEEEEDEDEEIRNEDKEVSKITLSEREEVVAVIDGSDEETDPEEEEEEEGTDCAQVTEGAQGTVISRSGDIDDQESEEQSANRLRTKNDGDITDGKSGLGEQSEDGCKTMENDAKETGRDDGIAVPSDRTRSSEELGQKDSLTNRGEKDLLDGMEVAESANGCDSFREGESQSPSEASLTAKLPSSPGDSKSSSKKQEESRSVLHSDRGNEDGDELFKDTRGTPVTLGQSAKTEVIPEETKDKTKLNKDAPSAFRRSPPPLFDDDDDDISWI